MQRTTIRIAVLGVLGIGNLARGDGKIVVAHDDWTLSNNGFISPSDGGVFALNVASFFTGGGTGQFLVYTSNFGLNGTQLIATMTGAGHTWTRTTAVPFTLATLSNYDGVFLGGFAVNNQVLIDYVHAGGNVYLFGGSAQFNEATTFNTFLNAFGLSFASGYNGLSGHRAITSAHPLFAGVTHLYDNNGSTISDLQPTDPRNQIIFSQGAAGLYAVYQEVCVAPPDGDMNASGSADGTDIQPFLNAVFAASTTPADLCHGDFSGNSVMDAADVPGFVAKLLGP